MIEEEHLTAKSLLDGINIVSKQKKSYISSMEESGQMDSIHTIIELINKGLH